MPLYHMRFTSVSTHFRHCFSSVTTLFHRFKPVEERNRYDEGGQIKHHGHAQFSRTNDNYVKRMEMETDDEHIRRSFAAANRGAITRMGTMDVEWLIGELDKYVVLSNLFQQRFIFVSSLFHLCFISVSNQRDAVIR